MSGHETGSPLTIDQMDVDAFHLKTVAQQALRLELDGQAFSITKEERVEPHLCTDRDDEQIVVIRYRAPNPAGERHDMYYSFPLNPAKAADMRHFFVLEDELSIERRWIEDSEFEKIRPRHEALVKKTAEGVYPARQGEHEDARRLLRVVHQAVAAVRQQRS